MRRFAFDSVDELDKLAAHAPGRSGLRPAAHRDLDSIVPSEGKFGVDPAQALDAHAARPGRSGCGRTGIAFHVGSQMLDPARLDAAQSCRRRR